MKNIINAEKCFTFAYICELGASGRQCGGKWQRNQDVRNKQPDKKYKLNFFIN